MRTTTKILLGIVLFIAGYPCQPSAPPVVSIGPIIEQQAASITLPQAALPVYQPGLQSSFLLGIRSPQGGGSCTGSKVAPHTLLSAGHCFIEGRELAMVNDTMSEGKVVADDGNDHVFVRVPHELPGRIAKIAPPPPAGTEVYIWGNPRGLRNVLRVGRLAGVGVMPHTPYKQPVAFIDINTGPGDSGAGYFDAHGNIVAVVSGDYAPPLFQIAYALPIAFTPAQLKELQ